MKGLTMLKRVLCACMLVLSAANAGYNGWFGELGWQISASTMPWHYDSYDPYGNILLREGGAGTNDMVYLEAGRFIPIEGSDANFAISAGSTWGFKMFYLRAGMSYRAHLFSTRVLLEPKLKILFPYANNYYDEEEDKEFMKKVWYGDHVAYAGGFETVWGRGKRRFVVSVEYITHATFKGEYHGSDGDAYASLDLNALYIGFGIRF